MNNVFVTYSWDNPQHQMQVFAFCKFLREKGFNATVDVALSQEETTIDFFKMMHKSIVKNEKVIIVLSTGYKYKADAFTGGVGQEYELIIKDIISYPRKYILVSFCGIDEDIVPLNFKGREILDLSIPDTVNKLYSKLLDENIFDFGEVSKMLPNIERKEIPNFQSTKPKSLDSLDWRNYIPYYLETFDEGDADLEDYSTFANKLNEVWHPRKEEFWESTITKGYFKLVNLDNPAAVKYIWIDIKEKDMSQAIVSVEVDFAKNFGTPVYGGGLIYRFQHDRRYYYTFIINKEKHFGFYLRHVNGYKPIISGQNKHINTEGFNKVGIGCDGTKMNLYINENLVLSTQSLELADGCPGVIAMGGGEFMFDNFSLYDLNSCG